MEFTLLAAAATGVAAMWGMLRWEAPRGNAARCAGDLWGDALTAAVAGIFGGRLLAMVLAGTNPLAHPGDILIVRSGVSTVGAVLTAVVAFLLLSRREPVAAADGVAAAGLVGLAGWQAGCTFRGACLGTATDLPWALTAPGSTVGRHPVEWYAALLLVAAGIALALWKTRGRPAPGLPASVAVLAAAGIRLVTEPLRPSLGGSPWWFYALGVLLGILGVLVFSRRARPAPAGDG